MPICIRFVHVCLIRNRPIRGLAQFGPAFGRLVPGSRERVPSVRLPRVTEGRAGAPPLPFIVPRVVLSNGSALAVLTSKKSVGICYVPNQVLRGEARLNLHLFQIRIPGIEF